MESSELTKLGLTQAESAIYLSVLKLGVCTVRDVSKECGFHRTNIYDVLEQLKEKGLITFFKEGKTTKYQASDPNNLYEFLSEKKDFLDSIFADIKLLHKESAEGISVEVYKGKEGMKSAFRDMMKEAQPIYGFGIKGQLREKMPFFGEQWIKSLKARKIQYYGIYSKRSNLPSYYTEIRFVSEELSSPVATFIYGDKININIWEPTLVSIVIKSALVAQMYRKHFDLLWKIAKR
jgi:sugar-specific transcriptional regulator TrmB